METTFYEDERIVSEKQALKGTMNKLRSQMTLDFNNGPPSKKRSIGQILASPDLNMLKLASPELEKMIIQHNGLVTTPTPTQILFPKMVTEEQEAYARGFMDALAKLQNGEEGSDSSNSMDEKPTVVQPKTTADESDVTYTTLQNASSRLLTMQNRTAPASASPNYNFTTVTSLPDGLMNNTDRNTQASNASFVPSTVTAHSPLTVHTQADAPRTSSPYMVPTNQVLKLKEEPQTVPSIGSTPPMSPMLSPINMDDQEQQKVERKRARNRVAARKCRYRKLERISRLEDRVTELKNQNSQLSSDATALKEQVLRLKQQILEHVNSGCNIMITSSVL